MIGCFYVKIKEAHIYWGSKRNTETRKIRKKESYIAIPAAYAYMFDIKKGQEYTCLYDDGTNVKLMASGSQSKRIFAKQFQGKGDLSILYNWYNSKNAIEGDYVVVEILDKNTLKIKYISQDDSDEISKLRIEGSSGVVLLNSNNLEINEFTKCTAAGFRLKSLVVKNNGKECCNVEFYNGSLIEDKGIVPFTSLLIGVNGAGKSYILKTIAEIFNAVCLQKQPNAISAKFISKAEYDNYTLEYFMDNDLINISINCNSMVIHRNNKLIEDDFSDKELFIPKQVLAVSYMVNDKFPYINNDKNNYKYLGIRSASNASWITAIKEKMIDSFFSLISKSRFTEFIEEISSYINIDPSVALSIKLDNKYRDTKVTNQTIKQLIEDKKNKHVDKIILKVSEDDEHIKHLRNAVLDIKSQYKNNECVIYSNFAVENCMCILKIQ